MQARNSALEQVAALTVELDTARQLAAVTARERDETTRALDCASEQLSVLTKERDAAILAREELTAKYHEIERRMTSATAALQIIQNSVRWRVLNRLAPLFPLARPVVAARRMVLRRVRSLQAAPVENEAGNSIDLLKEATLVPRWDNLRRKYELAVDEEHNAWLGAREGKAKYFVDPYVIEIKKESLQGKERPRILHVIPNVFVGGSTQLVKDIVEYTSDVFDHEVLTSALWQGGAHVGLTVHHVPLKESETLPGLIADIQPDIAHVHYWGLTDDPWYFAVMNALHAAPRAKIIENVNTPIAPLIHPRIGKYAFVSEYVRREFGSGVTTERSVVIHPGIDLSRFSEILR